MKNSTRTFLYIALAYMLFFLLLNSCSIVEDYQYAGEETLKGTLEYDFHLHEHFENDTGNECFYYHDTIIEEWELTIENIIKTKKIVWNRKN